MQYVTFGKLLIELRQRAGIASQADFARLVKSKQQTVSRWEAGLSRPRDKQIPLIAGVLNASVTELLAAAGFTQKTAVVSFDQPFPIDALSPDSFERFCRHFLQAMYPDARVERAGGQGHTQDGLDVSADFPDGTTFSFQCKRTGEFGPQKVHAAVAKHIVTAAKKVLLLTKVASPQARAAMKEHAEWEIWDREDIAHNIRQLSTDDQIRLVDIFFRGQRFALLGISEAGPWETSEEFFAAYASADGVFNHVWDIVGRKQDSDALQKALSDTTVSAVLLIGTGGSGKSRILKQATEKFEARHRTTVVRYLSRNAEITKKSLEDLGDRRKLLIVDDAHDQSGLTLLFQYAADPSNHAKLVLAFRPYGLSHIKAQASDFSLLGPMLREIILEPLTAEETEQLAIQVLKKHSGPLSSAKDIARLTRDCPLATVVGAQIVAKERLHFDFAQHEDTFRNLLFARFQTIIAGQIGNKNEAATIKKILRTLALLQPIHPEDHALLQIIEQAEGIPPHDSSRFIRLLTEAGVLFKRGAQFRLSPDVLADYIIEENCVGHNGASTGYAEMVFGSANETQAEHLLVNLSRLDWRRSNGYPSNSKLVDGVWSKLKAEQEYGDPHIKAVRAVAYYQPLKAIEFVEPLIREGRYLNQLPQILRYAAYHIEHLERACEGLWELGKRDSRPLNQHPEHAIRILAEMCEVQPNKPFEYNEKVVNFGLSLIGRPDSWNSTFTPLDILKPIFQTEGHTTTSHNYSMSFSPYFVHVKFVLPLRKRVLDSVIGLLSGPDVRVGVLAASALTDAFRYPMGMFNSTASSETRDEWTDVFVEGLTAVEAALRSETIDPLVRLAVLRSISWHVNYAKGRTSIAAHRLKASLPTTLEFRTLTMLVDGHGTEFRRIDLIDHQKKWAVHIDALVKDLLTAYPAAADLRAFIARLLGHIQKNDGKTSVVPAVLYDGLIRASLDYSRITLEDALLDDQSATLRFVPRALVSLWDHDPTEAREMIARLLGGGREQLRAAVAQAYSGFLHTGGHSEADLELLRELLADESHWVVQSAIMAIRAVPTDQFSLIVGLVRAANIDNSAVLADDLLVALTWNQPQCFDQLATQDVEIILDKLMKLPELDGHWIEEFLAGASKTFPRETAEFFMRRVDLAALNEDWKYRPANHGPYGHVALRFRESDSYAELLKTIAEWMREGKNKPHLFGYRARELFETMFRPFDGETVKFLEEWISTSDADDLLLIADIVGEAHHSFVFSYRPFVERFLEKAKQVGPKALKGAIGSLYGAAIGGIRTGTPGEPMPRDLLMKKKCEMILRSLPRFSPAFELYDGLRVHAEEGIEESRRTKESFED